MLKRESLERRCQEMKARNEAARRPQPAASLSQPAASLSQSGAMAMVARGDVPLIKVNEVAKRIGMSSKWVRSHFEKVPGVVAIRRPKRGVRVYTTMLIPENVLADELRKFAVRPPLVC